MQEFKIENFQRENPGVSPPRFTPLTDAEEEHVRGRLMVAVGQPNGTPEEIIVEVLKKAVPLEGVNLDKEETPLHEVFGKAQISPAPVLYVEWGALRNIDRFRTDDLDRHFYDVWYPVADDIEIFDDSMSWLMFIRHYGGVEVWRPA
jgi:hypothetical protein